MAELKPGLFAEFTHTVTEPDTAAHWGSGGIDVYSTPAMVGLMESTAYLAVNAHLPPGETTVGGEIRLRHLKATPLGMQVRARAELTAVDGRKLFFEIQAWDEVELIGEAEHVRFVIDQEKFMSKVRSKGK